MKCFVIMPFAKEFDDVYETIKNAVTAAVPGEEIHCFRLDDISVAGKISDQLVDAILESTICVADLTGSNANVMWESGYAMALRKPLVTIAQEVTALPFDLKDWKTVPYRRDSLALTLREPLAKAFRETLGHYRVRREKRSVRILETDKRTIAVTGSMETDIAKCRDRIQRVLTPYLSNKTNWFCGSFGIVDETAVEFLTSHSQNVQVVGYDAFDISPTMIDLLEEHDIPLVDPNREQLPAGFEAPTDRDLLLLTRTDLFVAFWNGKSSGTRTLIDWYIDQEKDFIIGFV